jgi:hypothetical protein
MLFWASRPYEIGISLEKLQNGHVIFGGNIENA